MVEQQRYGEIHQYDPRKKTGLILDANGSRLSFRRKSFVDGSEPVVGVKVTFQMPSLPNERGSVEITEIKVIADFDFFIKEKKRQEEKEILERAAEEALRLKHERQQAEEARAAREAEAEKQRKRREEEQVRWEAQRKEQARLAALAEKQREKEREARTAEPKKLLTDIEKQYPIGSRVFFPQQGSGIVKQIKGKMVGVLFDSQKNGNPIYVPANLLAFGQDTPASAANTGSLSRAFAQPASSGSRLSNYLWNMRAEILQSLDKEGIEAGNIYRYEAPEEPSIAPHEIKIDPRVAKAFWDVAKISKFYSHQVQAREALLQGKHIIIATPTASGKTEAYNPTILDKLLNQPDATALYLFPLVALGLDQTERLQKLNQFLPDADRLEVGIYNGSVSENIKKRTREGNNRILITTPDSLHHLFLPKAQPNWRNFFRHLRYLVVDEAHVYKGVFGANMANIVRRVLVRCRREGNPGFPQIIISSATVRNPGKLAQQLTGLDTNDFEIITESGAPKPGRHFLATRSDIHDLQSICSDLLTIKVRSAKNNEYRSVSTIVFSRSINEVKSSARALREGLIRSGRRDEIELVAEFYADKGDKIDVLQRLREGKVRCVFATTSLMAGIDIGSLDVAIVKSFPGYIMDARQMFGRAGRAGEGAIIFIADRTDPFDQFYFERPEYLFQGPVEDVVANPENPRLLSAHLGCAAQTVAQYNREGPLAGQWAGLFGQMGKDLLNNLTANGMMRIQSGSYYLTSSEDPHDVEPLNDIRSISSETYTLKNIKNNQHLETKRESTAFRDAHRDAIVWVSGRSYKVTSFDRSTREIGCEPFGDADLRTRGLEELDIEILSTDAQHSQNHQVGKIATLNSGEIRLTTSVRNYVLYNTQVVMQCRSRTCGHETSAIDVNRCPKCGSPVHPKQVESIIDKYAIPTPPTLSRSLKTHACWITFSPEVMHLFARDIWSPLSSEDENSENLASYFEYALHSIEHAILKAFPEYIPCDRDEIGGVYKLEKGDAPTRLFIYDNFQGGLGLSNELVGDLRTILEGALRLIERCTCTDDQGCPVCLSYFGCHNFNKGLSKLAGRYLLHLLLERDPSPVLKDLREYAEFNIPVNQQIYLDDSYI